MLLSLMDDPAKLPIAGTVVWSRLLGRRTARRRESAFISMPTSGIEARRKIEGLLGGVMQSTRPTHTL